MASKLIIDSDPGIGDALAVAMALLDPQVDLLAVTAACGSVSGEQATRNLLALVSLLDPPRWPRFGLAAGPAASATGDGPPLTALQGASGMGDFPDLEVQLHQRHDSAKLMIDLVKSYPNEITLLTLGPLTNVYRAAELHPTFLSELKSLVVQAGAYSGPGNVTPSAEFNVLADPEAAGLFCDTPAPRHWSPLM